MEFTGEFGLIYTSLLFVFCWFFSGGSFSLLLINIPRGTTSSPLGDALSRGVIHLNNEHR